MFLGLFSWKAFNHMIMKYYIYIYTNIYACIGMVVFFFFYKLEMVVIIINACMSFWCIRIDMYKSRFRRLLTWKGDEMNENKLFNMYVRARITIIYYVIKFLKECENLTICMYLYSDSFCVSKRRRSHVLWD